MPSVADKPPYSITQHAYQRARKRLGWKAAALDKMVGRIYRQGLQLQDTKGALRRYCIQRTYSNRQIRIYGHHIFFFDQQTLITLYRIDNSLLKHLTIHSKSKKMANTTSYNPAKKVSIKCTPSQYQHLRDFVKDQSIKLSTVIKHLPPAKSYLYSTYAIAYQLLEKLNNKVAELSTKNNEKLYNFTLTAVEAICLIELLPMEVPPYYQNYIQPILDRIKNTIGIK